MVPFLFYLHLLFFHYHCSILQLPSFFTIINFSFLSEKRSCFLWFSYWYFKRTFFPLLLSLSGKSYINCTLSFHCQSLCPFSYPSRVFSFFYFFGGEGWHWYWEFHISFRSEAKFIHFKWKLQCVSKRQGFFFFFPPIKWSLCNSYSSKEILV